MPKSFKTISPFFFKLKFWLLLLWLLLNNSNRTWLVICLVLHIYWASNMILVNKFLGIQSNYTWWIKKIFILSVSKISFNYVWCLLLQYCAFIYLFNFIFSPLTLQLGTVCIIVATWRQGSCSCGHWVSLAEDWSLLYVADLQLILPFWVLFAAVIWTDTSRKSSSIFFQF